MRDPAFTGVTSLELAGVDSLELIGVAALLDLDCPSTNDLFAGRFSPSAAAEVGLMQVGEPLVSRIGDPPPRRRLRDLFFDDISLDGLDLQTVSAPAWSPAWSACSNSERSITPS